MIRSRRGISLIELLVVMSACGVVLTLTSQLLCRVMRIQIESRTQVDVERNSLRLSEQLRHDVHQARVAVTSRPELGNEVFLRLQFADGQQTEYSRHGGTVLRQASGNGSQASREEFVFPATCNLSIQQNGAPPRLTLTITTGPNEARSGDDEPLNRALAIPVSLRVEATRGRDLRFATAPARQEAPE
jgi:type II secretory pathway pseudopilin PulG